MSGGGGGRETVDPGYMSRKIRKFRTDKFDTWNKRKFWLMQLMWTAGSQSFTRVAWVKISVCFTYRIYPFETFEFFCSCIRGRWAAGAASAAALLWPDTRRSSASERSEWKGRGGGGGGEGRIKERTREGIVRCKIEISDLLLPRILADL